MFLKIPHLFETNIGLHTSSTAEAKVEIFGFCYEIVCLLWRCQVSCLKNVFQNENVEKYTYILSWGGDLKKKQNKEEKKKRT